MEILIKNGRLIDRNRDEIKDVHIKDGRIVKVQEDIELDIRTIDAEGLVVMPAFVDLHAHFRDPGFPEKEDIESGSRAAVKGGYTTVNVMANTWPIASNMEVVDYCLNKAEKVGLIDLHQTVSVTDRLKGQGLEHLDKIDRKKVLFISDDGKGIISNKVSYDSMVKAKEMGFIIMTHAEDMDLTPIDYRISENIITFRDIYLSEVTGARLHLSHVSTKEAIRAIRQAKEKGVRVTCEVTPHHIALYDNDYRVNPPIREREDVLEIIEAIKDGTVDAIGTDHAPHTLEDKKRGAPGMSGIEIAFSLCYTNLVKPGHISLQRLSEIMSTGGAEIMNINKGLIEKGYEGDLTLIDLDQKFIVDSQEFISKGKNTPFDGEELSAKIVATLKRGDLKYLDEEYSI